MLDVSEFQAPGSVDWSALHAAGYSRAYVRVWAGTRFDKSWQEHRRDALTAGFQVFPYVVADPAANPELVAHGVAPYVTAGWSKVGPWYFYGGPPDWTGVPFALDWELPGLTADWYHRFNTVQFVPVVYSSHGNPEGFPEVLGRPPYWWVASWTTTPVASVPPSLVSPFRHILAWQYQQGGQPPRNPGWEYDRSYYYGGIMSDVTPPTPPTPAPSPERDIFEAVESRANEVMAALGKIEGLCLTISHDVSELQNQLAGVNAALAEVKHASSQTVAAAVEVPATTTVDPGPVVTTTSTPTGDWSVPAQPVTTGSVDWNVGVGSGAPVEFEDQSQGAGTTPQEVPSGDPVEAPPVTEDRAPENPKSVSDSQPHDEAPVPEPPPAAESLQASAQVAQEQATGVVPEAPAEPSAPEAPATGIVEP